MACRIPCKSCPWRKEAVAGDIPNFVLELAEGLADTCKDEPQLGDHIFACHLSKPEEEFACAGWLARYGWDSLTVRLLMIDGRIKPEELEIGENWPELHETYDEMMAKLRETWAAAEESP